jgi:hypothetical protein
MNWITPMDSLMESNTATYLSRLSALGVTHVAAPGGRPALVSAARQGALLVPVVADYRPQTVVDGNVRFPSFADSGYATREDERLRDEVLDYYAGGSGAYLLGDPVWLATRTCAKVARVSRHSALGPGNAGSSFQMTTTRWAWP